MTILDRLFSRASNRGLARAAATYAVTSWLVLEVGHTLSVILEVPHVAMKVVFWLLVLGFPITMATVWTGARGSSDDEELDLSPSDPAFRSEHHIHEEQHAAHGGGAGGGHGHAHGAFDPFPYVLGCMILAAVVFLGYRRFSAGPAGEETPAVAEVTRPAPSVSGPSRAAAVSPNSVAVLAFDNLSGDPSQDYFSDGISEELIDTLARIPRMLVAARTSSFAFKGKTADAATIGRQLGVAYLLEGSVRRDRDLVRISAELIDTRTGFRAWGDVYDRRLSDILAVQQGIAQAVAEALKVKMLGADASPRAPMVSPQAYDLYLRGRALEVRSPSEVQAREALADYTKAIAESPAFAAAYAGRARSLVSLSGTFLSPGEAKAASAEALKAAQRASELAPQSPDAQSTLGWIRMNAAFDIAGARAPLERAVQLGPNDTPSLTRFGSYETRWGDAAPGLAALDKARELDPLSPNPRRLLCLGLLGARRYSDAIAACGEALSLNPAMPLAHFYIGVAAMELGDTSRARAEFTAEPIAAVRATGGAMLAARAGDRAAAAAAADSLRRSSGATVAYQEAQIWAQLKDTDRAFEALGRARRDMDAGMLFLRIDPVLDPLRADPRFPALVAAMMGGAT